MMRHQRYLFACASILAMLSGFAAGLQVAAATSSSETKPVLTIVNRAAKSDRLTIQTRLRFPEKARSPAQLQPAPAPDKLPVGCEAAVSVVADSPWATRASRCVS